MKKAVVVLSGGQDSTTCLYWALAQGYECNAIFFDYGQKHYEKERECAVRTCMRTGVNLKEVDVTGLGQVAVSNLLEGEDDVSKPHQILKDLPSSFVPGRNLIFLTLASAWALTLGAENVVTGVCETDYSGYPDCRRVTIELLASTIREGMDFPNLEILTPLMHLDKAQTFKLAYDLGVLDCIVFGTHTGYNGDQSVLHEWGYGPELDKLDPASALRKKGWEEFKEKYPGEYTSFMQKQDESRSYAELR